MTEFTFVRDMFLKKFPDADLDSAMKEYEQADTAQELSTEAKCVMDAIVQYRLQGVFDALKPGHNLDMQNMVDTNRAAELPKINKVETTGLCAH